MYCTKNGVLCWIRPINDITRNTEWYRDRLRLFYWSMMGTVSGEEC